MTSGGFCNLAAETRQHLPQPQTTLVLRRGRRQQPARLQRTQRLRQHIARLDSAGRSQQRDLVQRTIGQRGEIVGAGKEWGKLARARRRRNHVGWWDSIDGGGQ